MKKLSNILNESVWGGMLSRSTGDEIRKEDDVNLLDPTDFAEYLQNHYTVVNYGKPADYSNFNGNDLVSINVFAFKTFITDLYYHYAGEKIALSRIYADSVKKSYPEFFIKLGECFSIEIEKTGHETNRIIFTPKDNSPISNAFFIEVLDKLIEIVDDWISKVPSNVLTKLIKKKEHMNESVWGGMLSRSTGDEIRKEDDVNLMDITSFVDYLNKIYLVVHDRSIYIKGDNTIIIPLLKTKEKAISGWPIYLILQNYDDDIKRKLYFSNKQFGGILCKHLYDKLQHKLTLKEDSEDFTMIFPENRFNGEKITNLFLIYALDTIIDTMDSKDEDILITKNIKESVWGGMLNRSVGDEIRKEDIINSNVKDIKPVDLGLSVLWADKDLEINDENEFTIDEIADYAPDGWRRPTQKEADELLHNTKKTVDQDLSPKSFRRIFKLSNNGVDLYFSCKNLKEKAEYWELDKGNMDEYWNAFVLEESGSFVAHSAYQRGKLNEKHRVRFVRER